MLGEQLTLGISISLALLGSFFSLCGKLLLFAKLLLRFLISWLFSALVFLAFLVLLFGWLDRSPDNICLSYY